MDIARENKMPISIPKPPATPASSPIHPVWFRLSHWINAVAVLIMVTSGWRVYNASPIFGFDFPDSITLGGWLGGALQWHFAGMWLLVLNGLFYLSRNIISGRMRRRLFPITVGGLKTDVSAVLHGKLAHADPRTYNTIQRLAYLVAILAGVVLVLSGLVLWKSVQFELLRNLMGGYDSARVVHFCAMAVLVGFVVVHVLMVILVPRTFLTMIRGRAPGVPHEHH
jgi:thiosulfate reductase cytochrome b subunit